MATYQDTVEAFNEAYKQAGLSYDEETATKLIQLAAEFYKRNEEEIRTIAKRELLRLVADRFGRDEFLSRM